MSRSVINFKDNKEISSVLAMLFLLIIGLGTTYYCLSLAQKIIEDAKDSQSFNAQKRIEKNNLK